MRRKSTSDAEPRRLDEVLARIGEKLETQEKITCRDDHRTQEEQACAARSKNWRAFLAAVGRRYESATLESFEITTPAQREAIDRLRHYADELPKQLNEGNGVVLYGPAGTGKDHVLVGVCRVGALRFGTRVVFCDGLTLFGDVRDAIASSEAEADLVRRYVSPPLLLLSDPMPPRGPLTDFQAGVLLRIIDRRYRACRPTLAALNVKDAAEADARLSPQIVDRLKDGALVLHFNWPSHRRKQSA